LSKEETGLGPANYIKVKEPATSEQRQPNYHNRRH
jgi:hypothetical protein